MEAVILAGGLGTRMRPLTNTRPKPLLPVCNRALIDRVIEKIPKRFDRILLPVNYLADQVREHFQKRPDPRVVLLDEPDPLGSAGALRNVDQHITGPFLVLNADILSSLDLESFWHYHHNKRALATISLWPVDDPWHFGVVRQAPNGQIVQFVEKPARGTEPSRLINAGHYLLDPSLLDRVPRGRPMSLEAEILTAMAQARERIFGMRFEGYWIDCGRPETYLEAHRLVLEHEPYQKPIDESVDVKPGRFGGYSVGPSARLGPRSIVERSVLLPQSLLGEEASIADTILGAGARVGARAHLERCVVGDGVTVPEGARIVGERLGMPAEAPLVRASTRRA